MKKVEQLEAEKLDLINKIEEMESEVNEVSFSFNSSGHPLNHFCCLGNLIL